MKAVAALGVLVLLLLAPPAVSQAPDDKLIVPGQGIGKWTLEMTIGDLVHLKGRPLASAAVRGLVEDTWALIWPDLLVLTRDMKRVLVLSTTGQSTALRTEKNIRLGSSWDEVVAAYGEPADRSAIFLIYDEIGIAFHHSSDRVVRIDVFRSRTAASIW